MPGSDPDHLVSDFLNGRLSRRGLIAHLMAMGAAASGAGALAAATRTASATNAASPSAADESDDAPTFTSVSIDHIALNVTDIPRSRDWYMQHLGMRPMRQTQTTAFLRCAEGHDFLALFKSEKPGLHHYSFAIPHYDQEDAARRLRAAGLTPKPRGRRMYFDDPDGIEVQVSSAPGS